MPMSCSIAAAHSSSRSSRVAGVQAGRGRARPTARARAGRRGRRGRSPRRRRGEVEHRRPADVLEQRRVAPLEQRLVEDALAQAGLGRLDRVEAAGLHHRLDDERARQDQIRAGGLDARGPTPRSAAGSSASRSTSSSSAARVTAKPWTPKDGQLRGELRRGGEVAHGAADTDEAAAARASQARLGRAAGDVRAQRLDLLGLRRSPSAGSARSCARRRAARSRRRRASRPSTRVSCMRAAAEVERDAVGQRGRVDRGQVAVAGLLLAASTRTSSPVALAGRARGTPLVGRVADRRRRHRPHSDTPVARQKCA